MYKEELGHAVWYCLHTYPYTVTSCEDLRDGVRNYVNIAHYMLVSYPCSACRLNGREEIERSLKELKKLEDKIVSEPETNAVDVEDALALWAHAFHERINKNLHKADTVCAQQK